MASDPTLQHLVSWAEAQPAVRAVLLTSSRANPSGSLDAFSDYDVIFFVPDVRPFHADDRWLADFGRVLAIYRSPIELEEGFENETGFERFAFITHFEDGPKIDFTFMQLGYLAWASAQPALPADLDLGYIVLLDKDGLTDGLPAPTYQAYQVQRPDEAAYQAAIQEFFNDALYVGKHLRRGDLIPAKYNLDYVCKFQLLRRMMEWRAAANRGWSIRLGAYGKGLKRMVEHDLWAQFERTYVGPGTSENWQALFTTLDLFQKVAADVGQALGSAYPHDQHARVENYLRKLKG